MAMEQRICFGHHAALGNQGDPFVPTFKPLSQDTFAELTEAAKVLEQDSFGPKVYQLADGNILKLFRRKRLLSSALLQPHSLRFWNNAKTLQALGIATLEPFALFRLVNPAWTAVCYTPLPGITLSHLLRENPAEWMQLIAPLARFIKNLHSHGIYFRSLHLGNIIRGTDGQFGLIDIADLQQRRRPLSKRLIRRNHEHFEKYLRKEDFPFDSAQLWAYYEKIQSKES